MHGGRLFHIAERMKRPISDFIDFSASINPLGLREAVREAIEEGIDAIIHYPSEDCRLLREILAEREGVSFDGIRIGNGAIGADCYQRY